MGVSLNSLSPELIEMIVRQLELDPSLLGIARYATISRPFQYATERILFHEISVDCYKLKGVPHLTSHRLSALREVQYSISFPQALLKQKLAARNNLNRRNIKTALDTRTQEDGDDDDDDGGRERPFPDDNSLEPENEASKSIRNEILTKEIRRMFGFLKTLTFPNSQPVYLRLLVCPPKPPAFAIQSSSKWKRIHTSYEEVRYSNSYLNIGDITDLPVITRINAVHFAGVSSRFIHPQGLLRIASKLAGLETLTLPFNDKPYRSEGDRRERRYHFAQALQDVQFLGLKELRLRLHHDGPYNPDFEPPSALRGLVPTNDYLSLAINQISQNLTTLKLTEPSIISPSLFCMQGGSKPHWPHLKHIRVDFHEITPEGEWRYNFNDFDDDGESLSHWSSDATWSDASDISTLDEPIFNGSLEWHDALRFAGACGDNPREAARKSTTPDMLSEMFIAAARASSAMPALQTMDIRSYRSSRPRASNRMIFLESSTYWRMLDLEYGEDEHHYKLDGKAASGPCVTWIRRRYDPKPVNEVWREVKGNRIRLSRIHLAQFPRSIKPWHNSDDDEDSESDESDPWDRYDYLQEMEEDMVFAYWDDL